MKYHERPPAVTAVQNNGAASINEMAEFVGPRVLDVTYSAFSGIITVALSPKDYDGEIEHVLVSRFGYLVKNPDGELAAMSQVDFEAKYQPAEAS